MDRHDRRARSSADTFLRSADRVLAALENRLALLAGIVVFAMMWFVVAEVVGRGALNAPIPGHVDLIELSMAAFAFLGIAECQRVGGHVRMKLLVARLEGRVRWIVEAASILLVLVVVSVLIKATGDHFWRAWVVGDSTIDMQLSTWPSKLITPVALATLWLRLTVQLWGSARLVVRPDLAPLAVPPVSLVPEGDQDGSEDPGGQGDPWIRS